MESLATIAVVEDDEHVRQAVTLVLESQGWDVNAYASGEAFIADLDGHPPDCVVLDPHLPGINGVEVAETVLEIHPTPLIILTARPDSSLAAKLLTIGAHAMLVKPATAEEIIERVAGVIRNATDRR